MLYIKFYFKGYPSEKFTIEEFDAIWESTNAVTKEV